VSDKVDVIRVLTWNIHRGIGPDGRYDLQPIAQLIRGHDPDIVAIQEIDSRGEVRLEAPPFASFASLLGDHVAEARTIIAPDGHYGHALISRWPLSPPILHDLSVPRHEPRMAIETVATTSAGPVHLAAVHLGLRVRERRRQAAQLAEIADCPNEISIMLGDFNDWPWRGIVRRTLAEALPGRTRHATYPAFWPLMMLDRVYCRPVHALIRSWTDRAARRFSDHLPVIADIRLNPGA